MAGSFLKVVLIKVEADAKQITTNMEGARKRKTEQMEHIQKAEQHSPASQVRPYLLNRV
jgi:hypothetical protein